MSVGLYDADFFRYHQTIFNLELMKLSTYFKKKREITIMSPSFAPDRYTSFYYRKDFNDGIFPKELMQIKNLEYGGFAFTNNQYSPLKEEIERCIPDVSIYERYKDIFIEDNPGNKAFFTLLTNAAHLRLSLDEQTIWRDFERQIGHKARVFILHDFNLNKVTNAQEQLTETLEKYRYSPLVRVSLGVKFPIVCEDFESFFKWLDFTFSSINFKLQYNGILKDEELNEIVLRLNKTAPKSIIYNPLPSSYAQNDFLEEDLIRIFKQVLFLYKNQKHFLLICNDTFSVPDEIKKMFNLFTAYERSTINPLTSMFYFTKELRKTKKFKVEIIDKPEAIEVFSYTQKRYPELFKLFYEASGAEFKGGELQIVR